MTASTGAAEHNNKKHCNATLNNPPCKITGRGQAVVIMTKTSISMEIFEKVLSLYKCHASRDSDEKAEKEKNKKELLDLLKLLLHPVSCSLVDCC
jgi:hypothetical protein